MLLATRLEELNVVESAPAREELDTEELEFSPGPEMVALKADVPGVIVTGTAVIVVTYPVSADDVIGSVIVTV